MGDPQEDLIRIEGLSLKFDEKTVLEDINLSVKKGDFLAIIGPNGGGKSTLIRCILGFLRPQKGKIFLWGKDSNHFSEWYRIGYVPQRAGQNLGHLNPMTVNEFLQLPSKWYRISIDSTYLDLLTEKFGIKSLLRKRLYQLSFGQLQRAFIVRALALKPELLILDEPSVGLDFMLQEVFYKSLAEFHKKGITIVLITHETWLITKEVNKVACLNQKLYFHGEHREFCKLAEENIYGFPTHVIEHYHW